MTDNLPTPYPFQHGVIVHVNSFTRKIDSGYVVSNGARIGRMLTAKELLRHLEAHSETKVDFQLI